MSEFLQAVLKYDPAQPRAPKGHPDGGQWIKDVARATLETALIEHGVLVTSDVEEAVAALTKGQRVELLQPRQVSTLLDRLAALALEAEQRGEKAPVYDLCKVTVRGTNLFCVGALDMERSMMPQFIGTPTPGTPADALPRRPRGTVDIAPEFVNYLRGRGYAVEETTESAAYLRASQRQLNGAKVGQMMNWLRTSTNPYGNSPPLVVSEDNYIIDGHHRWAALVGLDAMDNEFGDVRLPIQRVNIRIVPLLMEANEFADKMGMRRGSLTMQVVKALQKFDPDQPRAPKGSPDGGQWVKDLTDRDTYVQQRGLTKPSESYEANPQAWAAYYEQARPHEDEWARQMDRAISTGRITEDDARRLYGFYSDARNYGGYKEAPETLYHVTTALSRIEQEGFKTRDEHGRTGLGGGTSDTISFTANREMAEQYLNAMKFARAFMRDEISADSLLATARREGFYADLLDTYRRESSFDIDGLPSSLVDAMRGTRTWEIPAVFRDAGEERLTKLMAMTGAKGWDRREGTRLIKDLSPEDRRYQRAELLNRYLFWREAKTKQANPAFFTNDWAHLIEAPDADIALVEVKVAAKTRGYYLPAENEYRIKFGDLVTLSSVLRKAEWREEDHPRGKTTPESTPGSFAPKAGGDLLVQHAPPKDKPVVLAFGGSYNPMHAGHVEAAEKAAALMRAAGYDVRVVIMAPSADKLLAKKPAKEGEVRLTLQERAELAREYLAAHPGIEVSSVPGEEAESFEGKLKRIHLAQSVQRMYPDATVVNVTGEDQVEGVGSPSRFPALFMGDAGTSHHGYYYIALARDLKEGISSSRIRALLKEGKDIPEDYMPRVAQDAMRRILARRDVKKSWLRVLKDAVGWNESEHPRGKTTPESNDGSFAPKNSRQGELFDAGRGTDDALVSNMAAARTALDEAIGRDAPYAEVLALAEKYARLQAFETVQEIVAGTTASMYANKEVLESDLGDEWALALTALYRDQAITELGMERGLEAPTELLRRQNAYGDSQLSRDNRDWAEALDHYIGPGYDEINGYYRDGGDIDRIVEGMDDDYYAEQRQQFFDEKLEELMEDGRVEAEVESLTEGAYAEQYEALQARIDGEDEEDADYARTELRDLEAQIENEARDAVMDAATEEAAEYADSLVSQLKYDDARERFTDAEGYADEIKELIDSRPPTPETMVVLRGVKSGRSLDWGSLRPGTVLDLKGFTSTTSRENVASNFGRKQLKIVVPKGSHDVLFTTNDSEGEIIFNHGTRLTVLKASEMEVIAYYHPQGNNDPDDEDEVEKADARRVAVNFGRMATEPAVVNRVAKRWFWREEDHPRQPKGAPGGIGGEFRWKWLPPALHGSQTLDVQPDAGRPSRASKLPVLFNPTAAELRRWAGRDVKQMRYLQWGPQDYVVVWNSYEALHKQVADALIRAGHAKREDFDDAYWTRSSGYESGPGVRLGEGDLEKLLQGAVRLRKSWLEIIKDAVWREEDHPRGETVEGTNKGSFRPRNMGFVSPNIDENVDFQEAASRVQSARTKLLLEADEEISDYFGTKSHDTVGVGAWADGAEQSLLVDGGGDFEAFRAHMALAGLIADQKAVVAFTNDANGPDSLYRLSVGNRPLKEVHAQLLEAGVQFHTLRKTDHNVDVFVFAPGSEQEVQDAVAKAAEQFGVDEVALVRGRGEFIGSWDSREEGRAAYEAVLDEYEGQVPRRDGGWKALRDRWVPRLQAVRKSWLEVVKDWDESEHPRHPAGAPASRGGEFAPKGGTADDITSSSWGDGQIRRVRVDSLFGRVVSVPVIKNPTEAELARFVEPRELYRFSIDYPSGNYVVWNADDAIHHAVNKALDVSTLGAGYSYNSEDPTPGREVYRAVRQMVEQAFKSGAISDDDYDAVMDKLMRVAKRESWLARLRKLIGRPS